MSLPQPCTGEYAAISLLHADDRAVCVSLESVGQLTSWTLVIIMKWVSLSANNDKDNIKKERCFSLG